MEIQIISFGFSNGIPVNSDMIVDARILPNPHYVDYLRPLDGLNEEIENFVLKEDYSIEYLDKLKDFVDFFVHNSANLKNQSINISVGCTGGKHRSVVIAEDIYKFLQVNDFDVKVYHRDLESS
ncbi:hypothetical protein ACFL4T_04960 [candidate division KSB1 bacterium]